MSTFRLVQGRTIAPGEEVQLDTPNDARFTVLVCVLVST